MNTGKRLAAVAVLSAAPLLVTASAQANITQTHECLRAPCSATTMAQTTARYVHAYEARGWACHHVISREWLCVTGARRR